MTNQASLTLFPFSEYWWFYLAFTGFVFILLALDLGVFHRKTHAVSVKEAGIWSTIWILLSIAFGYGLYQYADWKFALDPRLAQAGIDAGAAAKRVALEYFTGYVTEEALSVDNIFVFVVVFKFFGIPAAYQHRVLFFGILGALLFRGTFIAIGAALVRYEWVFWLFGLFLIFTGIRMAFGSDEPPSPDKNPLIRRLRRYLPITPDFHGKKFFIRSKGVLYATPLFLTLFFIEITDIVFAVDSVPAIFAVTREPLIVFTSNIMAILGLRSLYFLLADAIERFHLLKYGLAIILVFVGLKMTLLNHLFGGEFPISWSLGIIVGVLATAVLISLLTSRKKESVDLEV